MRYFIRAVVVVLAGATCWCARAGADLDQDFARWVQMTKRVYPLEKTDPRAAVAEYYKFLQENPNLDPKVAGYVSFDLTRALYCKGQDWRAAMQMNEVMLAKYGTNATAVPSILQNKLRLLVDADEFSKAEEVAEQYLPLIATRRDSILRTMTHQEALATRRVFWSYCRALAGQKESEKLAGFGRQTLLDYPALLDERQQYPTPGWLYDQLVQALIDQNKLDGALQWAKVRFALCAFDTPSIERSTKTLAAVWTARDLSEAAAKAFAEAQKDAAKENPLAGVRFPEVDQEKLKPLIDAFSSGKPNELHDRVSLLVLAGRDGQAMIEARQMLLSNPKAPDGSQQICRILKAADGSVRRAHAFIEYVASGTGENPVAEFLKEHPAPEDAAKP